MIGPLMVDVAGTALTPEDADILQNPLVGGIILFTRNFQDKAQLTSLCADIRAAADRPILIAVDHEGGRVQRFRDGFTKVPPMRLYGERYEVDPQGTLELCKDTGRLIAAELTEVGVDFSFTPVVDLDYGVSEVIGNRAFHRDTEIVATLAAALTEGLREYGMAAVAKHFPGHGGVEVDSHIGLPVDSRSEADICDQDMAPFKALSDAGVEGVMPAHVIYEKVDSVPAGFSRYWLQEKLRRELRFDGVIFSDDLSMQAAHVVGGVVERANAAADAGCDMLLLCNDRESVKILLDNYTDQHASDIRQRRLQSMSARETRADSTDANWHTIRVKLKELDQ